MKHISEMEKRAEKAIDSLNTRSKMKQKKLDTNKKLSLAQIKDQLKEMDQKFNKEFDTGKTRKKNKFEALFEHFEKEKPATDQPMAISDEEGSREIEKEASEQKRKDLQVGNIFMKEQAFLFTTIKFQGNYEVKNWLFHQILDVINYEVE